MFTTWRKPILGAPAAEAAGGFITLADQAPQAPPSGCHFFISVTAALTKSSSTGRNSRSGENGMGA